MIRIKKRRSEVNKLREEVANLSYTVKGGFSSTGLQNNVMTLDKSFIALSKRLSVLEEIVRESGLVTDFDADEIKIREDRKFDIFGGTHTTQVPYQINKVKVK